LGPWCVVFKGIDQILLLLGISEWIVANKIILFLFLEKESLYYFVPDKEDKNSKYSKGTVVCTLFASYYSIILFVIETFALGHLHCDYKWKLVNGHDTVNEATQEYTDPTVTVLKVITHPVCLEYLKY
jgi:hypothetical protein